MIRPLALMLASTLARLLTAVGVFIVMARVWGAQEFGVFLYPYTIASLVAMIVDYGYSLQLVRDVGAEPHRVEEIVSRALRVKVVLAAAVLLGVAVAGFFMSNAREQRVLLVVLTLSTTVNSFAQFLNLPFRGLARFEGETRVVVWANGLHFVFVCVALAAGAGATAVAFVFLLSRGAYLCLSVIAYRQVPGGMDWMTGTRSLVGRDLATGLPYGVHVALATLYFQVDTLLVQYYLGSEGVGLYQVAVRLVMGAMIVPDVLSNVYLPALAGAHSDPKRVYYLAERMMRHLAAAGLVCLGCFTFGADILVRTLYGPRYVPLQSFLPLFGPVVYLRFLGACYGVLLTMSGRQSVRAAAVIAAFVVSLLGNALVIPKYGLVGAAIAAIFTHLFLNAVYVASVVRQFHSSFLSVRGAALTAIACVASLGVLAGPSLTVRGVVLVALLAIAVGVGITGAEGESARNALRRIVARVPV